MLKKVLNCDQMDTQPQELQVSQQWTALSPLVKLMNDQFVCAAYIVLFS